MCACSEGGVKRKRLKNTTQEQYELYLQYMESDYAFRSGTLNPTLEPNYLQKKWEELAEQLNAIGNGPALSAEDWKKRFTDWKYSTKAKYRKIQTDYQKTGGGPPIDIKLTPLEERGLNIWGLVTVAGNSFVTTYEGLPTVTPCDKIPITIIETPNNSSLINSEINIDNLDTCEITNSHSENHENEETILINVENSSTPVRTVPQRLKRPKPLSVLSERLINLTESNVSCLNEFNKTFAKFVEEHTNIEKKKIEMKQAKLQFKVKKFKFLHPDFEDENST